MTNGAVALHHHHLAGPESAPILATSNSLGTTLRMWDDQASELSDRFRLLRYDRRGRGGSLVPPGPYTIEDLGRDALGLLDWLGIACFSFCGLSIGGMVTIWIASEVSEWVDRLVLCCTSAGSGRPGCGRRAPRRSGRMVSALSSTLCWSAAFPPPFRASQGETVERAVRMSRDTPSEDHAGCCEAIRKTDLSAGLGEIRAPTLVIASADDPANPPDHAKLICEPIPDARLVVIPQAAHLANIEQPVTIPQAMLYHLEPIAERRAG